MRGRGEAAMTRLERHHPELATVCEMADMEVYCDDVETLLLLVGEERPRWWIEARSRDELTALADWASRVHLSASDNVVRIPPRPACLAEAV